MRNLYDCLDKQDLSYDKQLVALVEFRNYCQDNNEKYIRYAQWKDLCNERVRKLTGGLHEFGSGSFNSLITRLLSQAIPAKQRYFKRKVVNRETQFHPNLPLMNNYIQKKIKVKNDDGDGDTIRRRVKVNIPLSTTLSMKVIRGPNHPTANRISD